MFLSDKKEYVLKLSDAQYKKFIKDCEDMKFEELEKEYRNLNVLDGYGWSIEYTNKDKMLIESNGSNMYPVELRNKIHPLVEKWCPVIEKEGKKTDAKMGNIRI